MYPRRMFEIAFLATTAMLSSGCIITGELWEWALAPDPAEIEVSLIHDSNSFLIILDNIPDAPSIRFNTDTSNLIITRNFVFPITHSSKNFNP